MTPRELLDAFDVLADAPDGIKRLRELILSLAVRGRLVPQKGTDGPAAVVRTSRKRSPQSTSLPLASGAPFECPSSWAWMKLRDITSQLGTHTPSAPFTYIDVGSIDNARGQIKHLPPIVQASDAPSRARKLVRKGSVIYSTVRPYLLNVAVVDRSFDPSPIASTAFAVLDPNDGLLAKYLFYVLRAPFFLQFVSAAMKGVAYPAISERDLLDALVPVPPRPEQQRIVARVDELMALLDQFEAARDEREDTRRIARDAALTALQDAPDPEAVEIAWSRITAHMAHLFTTPEDVVPLRQAVLDLAVSGRLGGALAPSRRARKFPAASSPPITGASPRENHSKWRHVSLGSVLDEALTGPFGSNLKAEEYTQGGTPVINPQNIIGGRLVPDTSKTVSTKTLKRLTNYVLEANDVIVGRRGEMGRCAVVTEAEAGWLCGTGSLILRPSSICDSEFIAMCLRAPKTVSMLAGNSVGSTMKNLNQRILKNLPISLPPKEEQRLAVKKVNEFMALCDKLEAGLTKLRSLQDRFAETAVHHVELEVREGPGAEVA